MTLKEGHLDTPAHAGYTSTGSVHRSMTVSKKGRRVDCEAIVSRRRR